MPNTAIIIAYACSPYQGSEAGVGWGIVSALSKIIKVIAFVEQEKFEHDIRTYLAENPLSTVAVNVHFIFICKKRCRRLRKLFPPSYYWQYRRWHYSVYKYIESYISPQAYDLVHQLTMVGYREPGFCYRLDKPFLIGPIGGMGYFRLRDFAFLNTYGKIYYICYNVLNFLDFHFSSRVHSAWRKASQGSPGVICADPLNALYFKSKTGIDPIIFPEIGPPSHPNARRYRTSFPKPPLLRLCWAGVIENRKGLVIVLRALRSFTKPYVLDVYGDGPLMRDMIRYTNKHQLNVNFHLAVSRSKILQALERSHALIFTSLRDLSATVTIEANHLGVPVICFDRGGYYQWLDSEFNFKIEDGPLPLDVSLLNEINRLYHELFALGDGSLPSKASSPQLNPLFDWSAKAKIILELYANKLNASSLSAK